jgi:hypothetical protein
MSNYVWRVAFALALLTCSVALSVHTRSHGAMRGTASLPLWPIDFSRLRFAQKSPECSP